jgi:hypothetical protein
VSRTKLVSRCANEVLLWQSMQRPKPLAGGMVEADMGTAMLKLWLDTSSAHVSQARRKVLGCLHI